MELEPLNLSNLNDTYISDFGENMHFSDVLTDFCTQIDEKLLLCGFLILSYFIFKNLILPKAYEGFESYLKNTEYQWLLDDYLTKAYERALSLLETFAMGSAIFLIVIFYYQQSFPIWMWIFIVIYSIFLGSFIISWLIGAIRRKFSK